MNYPTPKKYLTSLASAVSKRCGIHQATVEQVLPALFDELRYRIVEDRYHCVPIESFGTFGLKQLPERQHMYNYKDVHELRTLPPKQMLKFYPTRNMRLDVERGSVDWSRRSFSRHPDDPPIRKRKDMHYRPMKEGSVIYKGATAKLSD